jgi:hypothetical protein
LHYLTKLTPEEGGRERREERENHNTPFVGSQLDPMQSPHASQANHSPKVHNLSVASCTSGRIREDLAADEGSSLHFAEEG